MRRERRVACRESGPEWSRQGCSDRHGARRRGEGRQPRGRRRPRQSGHATGTIESSHRSSSVSRSSCSPWYSDVK